MAHRAEPIGRHWPGLGAAVLVGALTLGSLAMVWSRAGGAGLGPADWTALRFTLVQATLSALCSVALAVPVARALARRQFAGRSLLITLLGAPFILPVIVAILGLLAVFGRAGWLSALLGVLGLEPLSIYGLHGVVLAHVFFNLPLATRLILHGWADIPAERFRLSASLGARPRDVFRLLEWPMLRRILPGAFAVVFVICVTSFAVALTLGGGPKATTIELAIYQAFRFEFDLARAATLALLQVVICALAGALTLLFRSPPTGAGLDRPAQRFGLGGAGRRVVDGLWIGAAALFILAPITAVTLRGLPQITALPAPVWQAALRSVGVALGSTALCCALALALALAVRDRRLRWLDLSGYMAVAASPLVIGTGLYLLLFPIADPAAFALGITALVNAVMALPFVLRALVPAVRAVEDNYGALAASLSLRGMARLRLLWWPRLRRPLGFGAGLCAALSMGDLGVIALFADPEAATLPLQVYRLMGAYRMDQAAGAGLLLLLLCLAVFWIFDRGGRGDAGA